RRAGRGEAGLPGGRCERRGRHRVRARGNPDPRPGRRIQGIVRRPQRARRLEGAGEPSLMRRIAIGGHVLGHRPSIVAASGEPEGGALTAADGADVVELRADLFADPDPDALAAILVRLRAAGRPLILTVRAAAEGGRPLADDRRAALYAAGLPLVDAVDVEI